MLKGEVRTDRIKRRLGKFMGQEVAEGTASGEEGSIQGMGDFLWRLGGEGKEGSSLKKGPY